MGTYYNNWPKYDDDVASKAYVDSYVSEHGGGLSPEDRQRIDEAYETATETNRQFTQFYNIEYPTDMAETAKIYYRNSDEGLVTPVNDPSLEWTDDLTKKKHEFDVWMQIDTGKTLVYYDTGIYGPNRFEWRWQNIPSEILERIDGNTSSYQDLTRQLDDYKTEVDTKLEDTVKNQQYTSDIALLRDGINQLKLNFLAIGGSNLVRNSVMMRPLNMVVSGEEKVIDAADFGWRYIKNMYCISQPYKTIVGKRVNVSFRYYKTNTDNVWLGIYAKGETDLTVSEFQTSAQFHTQEQTTGWKTYSFSYIATQSTPYIRIQGDTRYGVEGVFDPTSTIRIDDQIYTSQIRDNTISGGAIKLNTGTYIADLMVCYSEVIPEDNQEINWQPHADEIIGLNYWFDLTGLHMYNVNTQNKMNLSTEQLEFDIFMDGKHYILGPSVVNSRTIQADEQAQVGNLIIKKIDDDITFIF